MYLKKIKIGNVELENNIILAPMAGVTDLPFRIICKKYGNPGLVCNEMVSSRAICYKDEKTLNMIKSNNEKRPISMQIFGNDPEIMGQAAKFMCDYTDILDVNMGCPAPKIVNNGEGSALLTNLPLAKKIIEACVKATTKPITVKFRKGMNEHAVVAVEFAKMCEQAGASAITLHGRTREQYYSGQVDYDCIKAVKNAVHIPVIGNGDVVDEASYQRMKDCGVDAVMIGRGALGNPCIFAKLLGKPTMSTWECVQQHVLEMLKYYDKEFVLREMRKHFLWYLKGVKGVNAIKTKIVTMNDLDEVMHTMKKILQEDKNG